MIMNQPDPLKKTSEITIVNRFEPTGDADVDACFSFDYTHCEDGRVWSKIEGLKEVPGLVKQDRLEDAWSILEAHQKTFYDFDFIYAWKALIFQKNGQVDAAKKTLRSGLMHAKGKFLLYDRFGFLEYETGDLNQAVSWWIKSIVTMVTANTVTMWEPFIYLAYVARACGSETHFKTLMAQVADISVHGELSLEANAVKRLHEKASTLPVASVLKAIDCLCKTFIKNPGGDDMAHQPLSHDSFIKKKKGYWRLCLAIAGLILVCIFIFFTMSPPPPDTSKIIEPPEIKTNIEVQQKGATPALSKKTPEIEIKKEPGTKKAMDQLQNKKKLPQLKVKTKSPDPVIKKKD